MTVKESIEASRRGDWQAVAPRQFVDRRTQFRRDERGGIVRYGVRAYHGVVVRRNPETGKAEYEACPHAHAKPATARKCAEAAARRWNRNAKREAKAAEK